MDEMIRDFYEEMEQVVIEPYGIIDSANNIHTLGTDSKIIGRVFEMFAQPVLEKIAQMHGLTIVTPQSQTVYPDFVLMKNASSDQKIAVDIKSTYVETANSTIKFTLGSFASYMRNNTKNIEFKYTDYIKHYVIGFVYKRNGNAQESAVYNYGNRASIQFPFYDVKYFMQEKYKIAGDKPGSGNTENIGSFPTKSFLDLKDGKGPFATLGPDVFDLYWRYYPKYRSTQKAYTSLDGFLRWFPEQDPSTVSLLHEYNYDQVLERIIQYSHR